VLALLAVGAGAALLLRGRGRPQPRFHRLTFQRGFVTYGRFAPDGATVVYSAGWEGDVFRAFTTRAEGNSSRPLDLPPSSILAISKDGDLALLLQSGRSWEAGTLALAPLAGGAPRSLAENVSWADFLPDGKLSIARCGPGGCALESPIGTVRLRSTGTINGVSLSPDGRSIAFSDWRGTTISLRLLDLASGRVRTLVPGLVAISPALVWHRGEIWYSAVDGTSPPAIFAMDPKGGMPRTVIRVPTALNLCDVAPDGRVLADAATWREALLCSTPAHPQERDLSWMDWSTPRDLSDDGKTVLFNEGREAARGKPGIWIRPTDGGPAVRLGDGNGLALSPDGTQALALLGNENPPRLALWPTGPGTPTFISSPKGLEFVSALFFPDGKRLVVAAREPEKQARFYTLELPAGAPKPFTGEVSNGIAVSPDGTLVAGATMDGKIALFPVAGGDPRVVPGLTGSTNIVRFAPDGRSIYVYERRAYPLRVERVDIATGQRTLWKELAPADLAGVTGMGYVLMTPDARTYAYGVQHHFSDLYLVEGLE
jgi:WD40 repeat protein